MTLPQVATQDITPAYLRDANSVPVTVPGYVHGSGVDTTSLHNLGTIAADATGTFPANGQLYPGEYEFVLAVDAALGGNPANDVFFCVHKGGTPPADPTTKWHLWPSASVTHRKMRWTVKPNTDHISIRNPLGAAATLRLFAAKMV